MNETSPENNIAEVIATGTRPYKNNIIPEASKIINNDRMEKYGHASVNFSNIAAGWAVIFADGKFTPRRVAMANIWTKICRDVNSEQFDNAVDIVGYGALMDEV